VIQLKRKISILVLATGWVMVTSTSGCMSAYVKSVGGDTERVFTQIYLTDYNTVWQASLEALKSVRLDVSNREGGVVQTKWTDNTAQKNFADSFGGPRTFLKAQYRFRLSVAKGFYNGEPSVKVAVVKEQLIQRDVLEGWQPVPTDRVDEKTLLYRIGRIVFLRIQMDEIERQQTRDQLKSTEI